MTTFRSDLIDLARLKLQIDASNEPDVIGIEVLSRDRLLMSVLMNAIGDKSVVLGAAFDRAEVDLNQFRELLDTCEAELASWRGRLVEPAAAWRQPE